MTLYENGLKRLVWVLGGFFNFFFRFLFNTTIVYSLYILYLGTRSVRLGGDDQNGLKWRIPCCLGPSILLYLLIYCFIFIFLSKYITRVPVAGVRVYVGVRKFNPYPNPTKTRGFTPGFRLPVRIPRSGPLTSWTWTYYLGPGPPISGPGPRLLGSARSRTGPWTV